jgi:hypothetical protein
MPENSLVLMRVTLIRVFLNITDHDKPICVDVALVPFHMKPVESVVGQNPVSDDTTFWGCEVVIGQVKVEEGTVLL